jgi:hypothetical protein
MAAWWCRGPEGKSRWPSIGCKLETAAGYAVRVPLGKYAPTSMHQERRVALSIHSVLTT